MRKFRRIAVYCGSSGAVDDRYFEASRAMGTLLARRGIGLVYGGGRVGLMGAIADAVLVAGGTVIGVIPEKLQALEVGHAGLTELIVVDSMHARKTMMAHLSDAFVAMPGGWGTLEEIFEVTTWTQLNYHKKPVGLLNVGGYYDDLIKFVSHAAGEGFIRPIHASLMQSSADPDELLAKLESAEIPELRKWIDKP